jgi:phosphatidylinositol alpha-1,6-mannosyltransferase
MFRAGWPAWRPLVSVCREFKKPSGILFISHVFPIGTAALISKMFGGPTYAILVHGLDVRLAKDFWKRFLLRRICRNAHVVIANSESTKSDLVSVVSDVSVSVLTPGVEDVTYPTRDEARKTLGIGADERIVLSVARLVPRKGIDTSLRVMGQIQKVQSARYVVLGDGPDRERLASVAAEARTSVEWIRNADDDNRRQWLAAADVFLLPVRDEGTDVEGFGIVYLEAAKAGVPSIAGKSGGAAEAVVNGKTGLVANPKRENEVKSAVLQLLQEDDLRKTLGAQAKERADRDFRWSDRWVTLSHILRITT